MAKLPCNSRSTLLYVVVSLFPSPGDTPFTKFQRTNFVSLLEKVYTHLICVLHQAFNFKSQSKIRTHVYKSWIYIETVDVRQYIYICMQIASYFTLLLLVLMYIAMSWAYLGCFICVKINGAWSEVNERKLKRKKRKMDRCRIPASRPALGHMRRWRQNFQEASAQASAAPRASASRNCPISSWRSSFWFYMPLTCIKRLLNLILRRGRHFWCRERRPRLENAFD